MERRSYIQLTSLETRLQSLINLIESMKGRDRLLEERLAYIEDDIARIRFELRRMREMIEELYQRSQQPIREQKIRKREDYTPLLPLPEKISEKIEKEKEIETLGLSITEEKILKLLVQDPSYGVEGATGIAKTLGMAREHIARTMKKMVEKGLLIRDETKMPFTYKVPDEIRKKLLET